MQHDQQASSTLDARVSSLRGRRIELTRKLQMHEADFRATQTHLRELKETLAAIETADRNRGPRDPTPVRVSNTGRPTQFQMIVNFVRTHPARPTREQIIDALITKIPCKAVRRKKAMNTAIAVLVSEGSLKFEDGTNSIGERCKR